MDGLIIFPILAVIVGAFLLVFWIMMFLDVLSNKKLQDTEKILWGIGMLIFPVLAIIYFFAASSKKSLKL